MQLGGRRATWEGRGFRVRLICGSKKVGRRLQNNTGYAIFKKIVVRRSSYASNKKGDIVTLKKWSVLRKTRVGYTTLKVWIEGHVT